MILCFSHLINSFELVVDDGSDERVEALVDYSLAFDEFGGCVGCGVLQLLVEACLP